MYRNIKAAVMGSINTDIILNMDVVPNVGENVLGTTYGYANGGKGANQAVGLARLGAQVKMIGKVADDANGNKLIENLQKNNVDPSGVSLSGTSLYASFSTVTPMIAQQTIAKSSANRGCMPIMVEAINSV